MKIWRDIIPDFCDFLWCSRSGKENEEDNGFHLRERVHDAEETGKKLLEMDRFVRRVYNGDEDKKLEPLRLWATSVKSTSDRSILGLQVFVAYLIKVCYPGTDHLEKLL